MARRCLSCGGTYEPVQADGSTYFHACPEAFAYVDVKTGRELTPDEARAVADGATVRREARPRPDARDENVNDQARGVGDPEARLRALDRAAPPARPHTEADMIRAGAGAVDVDLEAPKEPA